MPAVIDTPECIDYVESPTLLEERSQLRGARLGFWRTCAHVITKHLTHMPHERQALLCSVRRPFEAPMDRLAREHPSLSILALSYV